MVDESGRLSWSADYLTWGYAVETREKRAQCSIRFQGQWYDEESQLHYNRTRYYDPALGRYINPDLNWLYGGTNLYQYAVNPINWIDPLGLEFTYVLYNPIQATPQNPNGVYYAGSSSETRPQVESRHANNTGQSTDQILPADTIRPIMTELP